MSDGDLVQMIGWAKAEQKARAEKHKQDTNAIRELARSIAVEVKITGVRGRPAKKTSK